MQCQTLLWSNTHMTKITAQELQRNLHTRLSRIAEAGPYSATRVFDDLAKISGISKSRIRYFYNGERPQLLPSTLDNLTEAVRIYERLNGK